MVGFQCGAHPVLMHRAVQDGAGNAERFQNHMKARGKAMCRTVCDGTGNAGRFQNDTVARGKAMC